MCSEQNKKAKEKKTMKHTLVCTLPNLKEKPLPVLDETLELTFKEGWNGHAYGPHGRISA